MDLRVFLLRSRTGRVLCIAVLALFLILCGIHIGSAHHDGDGDSFGVAEEILLFMALAVALLLATGAGGRDFGPEGPIHQRISVPFHAPPRLERRSLTALRC